jgi:hypothetical protein
MPSWGPPLIACLVVLGLVACLVRFWRGQGDGIIALGVWALAIYFCAAIWVGWLLVTVRR